MIKVILFSLFSFSVSALETDNFLAEVNSPADSTQKINSFINNHIDDSLKKYSSKFKNYSCDKVRQKVLKKFRGIIVHDIEEFIDQKLEDKYIFPSRKVTNKEYYRMSIYGKDGFDHLKYFHLSRGIKVNDVVFGSDKFSHFISTGIRYYHFYKKALKKGYSEEEAMKKAIRFGAFTEKTILGWLGSKVFSFADLEANFQGFLFNKSFCEKGNPFLKKVNGRWKRSLEFDAKKYVNPNWSEVFNPSAFTKWRFKSVKSNLENNYCASRNIDFLLERISNYKKRVKPSFSVNYLESLRSSGKIPDGEGQLREMSCFFK